MTFTILAVVLFNSGYVFAAEPCSFVRAEQKATQSALAIEAINGGTPLTHETHSLSSKFDTSGVILSYSGVQKNYLVTVDSRDCEVTRIEKI